ncbi:OLC1v1030945C1 [Oldenlandia corymbosa var. corymbosa]|nr:OLC1v1030945C1 [Oldenlandia corymbosa var. corymbosa]
MRGDWGQARMILQRNENAKIAKISSLGMTALHVAASCGRSSFVVELVKLLTPQQLESRDQLGRTALHHVALAASKEAARAMVGKNPDLPQIGDMKLYTPLFYAARWRHPSKSKEMLEYLYLVTKDEPPCYTYTYPSAANLIVGITASRCHDIVLRILQRHPELSLRKNHNEMSILHILAMQPSLFHSGSENDPMERLFHPGKSRGHFARQKEHQDALNLVHFICKILQKRSKSEILEYFLPSESDSPEILHLATEHGVYELVQVCLNYFPDLIWYANNDKRQLLHVAIEHRRPLIFNHIIELIGENTKAYADVEDEDKNNILHLAANLAPTPQLHSVRGPAFQMQRELQWFKAVEALVYDEKRVAKNIENKTPREVFFENHEPLMKNAKDWLKDTSNSCMVVATLVATVAFAAMITVPGGNDGGSGRPILSKTKLFMVFCISDAVSMISSAISLLMFLSIQTSRYSEEDFIESLPRTLLKGLLSLFIAVATMMIGFGTAIGLALQTRVSWAYIPFTIVACFPVILFTRLQLPLLFQTLIFTSGPGIFQGPMITRTHHHHRTLLGFCINNCAKPFMSDDIA